MSQFGGYVWFKHLDKQGNVLYAEEGWNNMADEGGQLMLQVFFQNGTAPDSTDGFEIALTGTNLTDTSVAADVTSGEPSGNGYARVAYDRNGTDWTVTDDSGDYKASLATAATFTASGGDWTEVDYCGLVAVIGGSTRKLVGFKALAQARTIANGEAVEVTYGFKLKPSAS